MTKEKGTTAVSVVTQQKLTYAEIENVARAFIASGMFGRDMDKISKGITKIMAGQELGLAPFASMRAIHIIEGNATLSANTMAGMVKSSPRYDYDVLEKTKDKCRIAFFELRGGARKKLGVEEFTMEMARAANLANKNNWKSYPDAMCFARCVSNGVRTYCPDVFNGMAVYTPDELISDETKLKAIDVDALPASNNKQIEAPDDADGVDPEPADDLPEPDFGDENEGVDEPAPEDDTVESPQDQPEEQPQDEPATSSTLAYPKQIIHVKSMFMARGVDKEHRARVASFILAIDPPLEALENLTTEQAVDLIDNLQGITRAQMPEILMECVPETNQASLLDEAEEAEDANN